MIIILSFWLVKKYWLRRESNLKYFYQLTIPGNYMWFLRQYNNTQLLHVCWISDWKKIIIHVEGSPRNVLPAKLPRHPIVSEQKIKTWKVYRWQWSEKDHKSMQDALRPGFVVIKCLNTNFVLLLQKHPIRMSHPLNTEFWLEDLWS